jgi:hypothetical protein
MQLIRFVSPGGAETSRAKSELQAGGSLTKHRAHVGNRLFHGGKSI